MFQFIVVMMYTLYLLEVLCVSFKLYTHESKRARIKSRQLTICTWIAEKQDEDSKSFPTSAPNPLPGH